MDFTSLVNSLLMSTFVVGEALSESSWKGLGDFLHALKSRPVLVAFSVSEIRCPGGWGRKQLQGIGFVLV